MDHIVCVDPDAKELDKLLLGTRTMIVRRAKEVPFGTVNPGDTLSDQLTEETSATLLQAHQDQLLLTKREMERWVRKQNLVLIAVENTTPIKPFAVDRSNYARQDVWLPIDDIRKVKTPGWSPWLARKRVYEDADLISDK
jgi:hypothetical protein